LLFRPPIVGCLLLFRNYGRSPVAVAGHVVLHRVQVRAPLDWGLKEEKEEEEEKATKKVTIQEKCTPSELRHVLGVN